MATATAGEVLVFMVAMFNTGNVERVTDVVDPEYLDHQGLGGQPVRGPEGFVSVVLAARSGYRSLDVSIEDLLDGGARAAARLRWSARTSGESDVRETLEIIHARDGRAVEHWGGRS